MEALLSRSMDLEHYYAGSTIPVSYYPAFIAISFVVSLLGSGSTLELINRRTSMKGLYNHILLLAAACSMGGIAIWSMVFPFPRCRHGSIADDRRQHFIGNRSIVLLNGEVELHIEYNPAITAASFFVPILVLLIAFLAVGTNEVRWWRLILSGTLSGSAICGMHYLGNASISNYKCEYVIYNVVGAAFIAVAASNVALSMFFVFRAKWTNMWWKKLVCTMILATAVSGMHWCAATGTRYVLVEEAGKHRKGSSVSSNTTIVAVLCLSVGVSIAMIIYTIYSARNVKAYAKKAQQIVLAAAIFDKHGRILVSNDGFLPSEKITETFPQRSNDEHFTTAHPTFHWMYRASRNWSSVTALLGWMVNHINSLPGGRRLRSEIPLVEENGQLIEKYDIIFRELFCLAASALASQLREDLLHVGALWDEIFATGSEPTRRVGARTSMGLGKAKSLATDEQEDLEKNSRRLDPETYGRGSLMLLVRHVQAQQEAAALEAAGFRFADPSRVVELIQRGMQVKTQNLEGKLREMAAYSERNSMPAAGVHVGLFAVRARVDKFGFDLLVNNNARHTIPSVRLANTRRLKPWHTELLKELDGLPIQTLMVRLGLLLGQDLSHDRLGFASELRKATKTLREDMDDAVLDAATIRSNVVEIPCKPVGSAHTCSLITLQLLLDINSSVRGRNCDFIPFEFFKTQQMALARSISHHARFSRIMHREISALVAHHLPKTAASPLSAFFSSTMEPTTDRSRDKSESSSEDADAVALPAPKTPRTAASKSSLSGGIMVSQEVAIDVQDASSGSPSARKKITGRLHSRLAQQKAPSWLMRQNSVGWLGIWSHNRAEIVRSMDKQASNLGRVKKCHRTESNGTPPPAPPVEVLCAGGCNVEATAENEEDSTFADELLKSCVGRRS